MPETVWFTSDTHFYHKKIVELGAGRPWPDADAMTEGLIERWNERVKPTDRIYHLGDFSFGNRDQTTEVLRRLRGNIHIIRGNHDSTLDSVVRAHPELVESYQQYKEIKIAGQRLVLFHFPILSWHDVHHDSWHLHGHCHGQLRFEGGAMLDVGVDVHGYAPVSYERIYDLLTGVEPVFFDHHIKRVTHEE